MLSKFISPRNTSLVVGVTTNEGVFRTIRFNKTSRVKPAYHLCREKDIYDLLKKHSDYGILFEVDPTMDDFGKEVETSEDSKDTSGSKDTPPPPPTSPPATQAGVSDEGNGVGEQDQGTDDPNKVEQSAEEGNKDPEPTTENGIKVINGISSVPDVKQWIADNCGIAKVKMPNIPAILNVCKAEKIQFPEFEEKHSAL